MKLIPIYNIVQIYLKVVAIFLMHWVWDTSTIRGKRYKDRPCEENEKEGLQSKFKWSLSWNGVLKRNYDIKMKVNMTNNATFARKMWTFRAYITLLFRTACEWNAWDLKLAGYYL